MPSITAPGYRDPIIASPGSQDMIPIFQHGLMGGQDAFNPTTPDVSGAGLLQGLLGEYDIKKGKVNPLLQAAIGEQMATQQEMLGTLENYGAGARAELEQGFTTRFNNILGRLEQRGLGASSGVVGGGLGLERERQLALGTLSDQLLGRRLDVLSGSGVSGLLAGLGQMEFQAKLQKDLLEQQQMNQPLSPGAGAVTEDALRRQSLSRQLLTLRAV